jgi:hypothetical protein
MPTGFNTKGYEVARRSKKLDFEAHKWLIISVPHRSNSMNDYDLEVSSPERRGYEKQM